MTTPTVYPLCIIYRWPETAHHPAQVTFWRLDSHELRAVQTRERVTLLTEAEVRAWWEARSTGDTYRLLAVLFRVTQRDINQAVALYEALDA